MKGPGTGIVMVATRPNNGKPNNFRTRACTYLNASSTRVSDAAFAESFTRKDSTVGGPSPSAGRKSMQFVTLPRTASTSFATLASPRVVFFENVASAAVVKSSSHRPCNGQSSPRAVPRWMVACGFGLCTASSSTREITLSAAWPSSGETRRNASSAAKFLGARLVLLSSPPLTPKSIVAVPSRFSTSLNFAMAAIKSSFKPSPAAPAPTAGRDTILDTLTTGLFPVRCAWPDQR
mmetsp:Transcript_45055/g.107051  ORF Transcript_45055/g.107051 Transcript_45055/m.107051 type:complete len:235 (+) Transcript_45055:178-882(+)